MKKNIFLILLTVFAFALFAQTITVFAEDSSNSSAANSKSVQAQLLEKIKNEKERIASKVADKKETKEQEREKKVVKVRVSIANRVRNHERLINQTENLLSKLQVRIDKAKAAGKDTTEMEKLMADAKLKLADAKQKLSEIDTHKTVTTDKAGFEALQKKFKVVWDDLKAVKEDASKIIRTLKGFNSATSEGKNPQKEGTKSGSTSGLINRFSR